MADTVCDAWNAVEFFKAADLADVDRCLEAGADPSAPNEKGFTPLIGAAAFNENAAIIAALLDAGADVNAQIANGSTPLHLAAALNKNPAIIAALLEAGADPNGAEREWQHPAAPSGGPQQEPCDDRGVAGCRCSRRRTGRAKATPFRSREDERGHPRE